MRILKISALFVGLLLTFAGLPHTKKNNYAVADVQKAETVLADPTDARIRLEFAGQPVHEPISNAATTCHVCLVQACRNNTTGVFTATCATGSAKPCPVGTSAWGQPSGVACEEQPALSCPYFTSPSPVCAPPFYGWHRCAKCGSSGACRSYDSLGGTSGIPFSALNPPIDWNHYFDWYWPCPGGQTHLGCPSSQCE